ncbi:ATP-binding protein [Terasakiella sp. A23]|uniref:hybrid sensor histidine kinase/response regulator n=1 Tax=Terasakiella sp. FCG-A23 TaxID=3080561 RepID=UPI002952D6DF|nr:ATP-binding protein [Terasakiella sp. A23]MDV7338343.1 ATP-binding protein [Terasakiella sp. A23]
MAKWAEQSAEENVLKTLDAPLLSADHSLNFLIESQKGNVVTWAEHPEIIRLTQELLKADRNKEALVDHPAQKETFQLLAPVLNRYDDNGYFIISPELISLASSHESNVVSPINNKEGNFIGFLAFRLDVDKIFDLAVVGGDIGETGELYAFNQDGLMLSKSRFVKQMQKTNGKFFLPDLSTTRMGKSATAGQRAFDLKGYNDYRGIKVVGSWLWNTDLGLGLAMEIDLDEAYGGLNKTYTILWVATLGITGTVLVLAIIAGRRRSEKEDFLRTLAASEKKMRSILENTTEGFWLFDLAGKIQEVNPAMCNMLASSRHELIGRNLYEFLDEQDQNIFQDPDLNADDSGSYELMIKCKRGEKIPCLFSVSSLFSEDGKRIGVYALVVNFSRQKEVEIELKNAVDAANQANYAKTQFLSSMSHELRTPLNAILGFAQLLDMRIEGEKDRKSVDQILNGGKHLLSLIDQILDLARIEQGSMSFSFEEVSPQVLIEDCVATMQPMADEMEVELSFQGGVSQAKMYTDYLRIKQCLLNLLSNAIKYNLQGGRVIVSCEEVSEKFLRLSVKDTGYGISKEKLKRLFVPFDRLDFEGSNIEGTGIGLSLTKHLIEDMKGTIAVHSREGEGTYFWLDVPLLEMEVDNTEYVKQNEPAKLEAFDVDEADLGKYRLLYVEDNPSNFSIMEMIIAELPMMHMISVQSAEDALIVLSNHRFDVALFDINLPGMNGIEAVQEMQKDDRLKEIPVIALSANAHQDNVKAALNAGFDAYLFKPIIITDFYRTLSDVMGDKLEITCKPAPKFYRF